MPTTTEDLAKKIEEEIKWCILHPQLFADLILPHWMRLPRPPFHEELYNLCLKEKVLVMAPRYFSKSTIFSRVYPLWKAITAPGSDYLITSATEAIAVEQLRFIKNELESNEKLRAYFGDMVTDKWTQDEIRLKNGSRIMAKGQGFQIRGLHPTHVTCDDLESEHVNSEEQRKKLITWFNTTLLGALGPGTQIITVGTVLHPQSLLKELAKKPDWTVKKYTALDSQGNSIWEAKAPTAWLLKIKANDEYAFQQEYMNNPLRSGQTLFREEWLSLRTPFPSPKTEVVFTAVDPAISKKDTADYTAIVTFGVQGEKIYELEAKRGRWSLDETLNEIKLTYQTWAPMMIGIEEAAYQKALSEVLIRDNPMFPVHPMKADKDKRRRAMGVTHLFQRGLVHLQSEDLISELALFTGTDQDDHDDLVDAAVYALHLVQQFCLPGFSSTTSEPDRRNLSWKEKAIWDGVHHMEKRQEVLRGVRVDPYLGTDW